MRWKGYHAQMGILDGLLLIQPDQGLHLCPALSQFQADACGLHIRAPCETCTLWVKQDSTTFIQTGLVCPWWTLAAIIRYHAFITWQLFCVWHHLVGVIQCAEHGPHFVERVVCGLWVIHQMNWGHYLIKAVSSYCIWDGVIVDIRVIWPIHMPPWYWTVARCEQNPIKTQQLIHAQINRLRFGLHWVEFWHLSSELP